MDGKVVWMARHTNDQKIHKQTNMLLFQIEIRKKKDGKGGGKGNKK